jgi:predicted hydrocarbon binding protein
VTVSDFVEKLLHSNKMKFGEGKFEMFGVEGLIIPVKSFTTMLEVAHEENKDDIFEMMFKAGKKQGEVAIEEIGKKNKMRQKEFISKMVDSSNLTGIGKIKVEKFSEEGLLVSSLTDSTIARELKDSEEFGNIDHPVEFYFKGLMHGLAKETFNGKIKSEFTKSQYMGDPKTVVKVRIEDGNN